MMSEMGVKRLEPNMIQGKKRAIIMLSDNCRPIEAKLSIVSCTEDNNII